MLLSTVIYGIVIRFSFFLSQKTNENQWKSTEKPEKPMLWRVTFCWGGGRRIANPLWSPKLGTGPISKIQTPFDSLVRGLSKHGVKVDLEVVNDVTGQVKVRMFDFSGVVTSASTILMLSANKANESKWILSLTFVSFPVLCDHNTGQGHLRSPGKRSNQKNGI